MAQFNRFLLSEISPIDNLSNQVPVSMRGLRGIPLLFFPSDYALTPEQQRGAYAAGGW